MATIAQLTRNPGPFIKTFLPFIQNLRADGDPYKYNEAAFIINQFQNAWGGGNPKDDDNFFVRSKQVKHTGRPQLRNASESALIANFRYQLNSFNMNIPNAWLELQKFIDLFYKLVDPLTYFLKSEDEAQWVNCPPPELSPCPPGLNFFAGRVGAYRRPYVAGEGTGFIIDNPVTGDGATKHQVSVTYELPAIQGLPCNPPEPPCIPLSALNDRYFEMYYTAVDKDVFWYDVDGAGTPPVVGGPGIVNLISIALTTATDTIAEVKSLTDAAIIGTTHWASIADCPPLPPAHPSCGGLYSTLFEADVVGARVDAIDGKDGYETPETTMLASDGSTVAAGVGTDIQWQDVHNKQRVPYEESIGNRIQYLKLLDELPCNPPEPPCIPLAGLYLQTPAMGIIDKIPVNTPAVLNNSAAGITRSPVIN